MDAAEAFEKLKKGNEVYLHSLVNPGNMSADLRSKTAAEGQFPYAVVITCSDSRVIPESIFSAGIGELFVIRVAGNVIDGDGRSFELGSVEYAVGHLGSPLVVVLGHTKCGAVGAALEGHADGHIHDIVERIKKGIGEEKDPYNACKLNVLKTVDEIRKDKEVTARTVGAIYDIESGKVEFLLPERLHRAM